MLHQHALSHHRHTGKLLPRQHTSYMPLAIVLFVVGFLLTFYTAYADSPPPQKGSIGLSGIMPGKPPTEPPVITSPTNNQRFPTSPVTVKGTCPASTLVEVFKNDIFAGSAFCDDNGKFSFDIDLMYGKNTLIARVYDALSQQSPDSTAVTVFYDALPAQASGIAGLDFGGAQLLLTTDAVYRGIFPDKEMAMPITVTGGRAPYAINVQWGDSSHTLIPRNDNAVFFATHTYKKPGIYPISLQATDADGRVAFITVAAIVNGQPDPAIVGTTTTPESTNMLLALWPLYVATIGIVISFWLGERREKRVLEKHGMLIQQL